MLQVCKGSGGTWSPSLDLRSTLNFCAWQSWLAGACAGLQRPKSSGGPKHHTKLRPAAATRDVAARILSLMRILTCLAR